MKSKLQKIIAFPASVLSKLNSIQQALGRIETRLNENLTSDNINDYEFKVSSQWGEDGIIQYLIKNMEIS